LELLQNADDAEYGSHAIPKLTITLTSSSIRFDTNERGFCWGDVEAICSIAESSKTKGKENSKARRIGEKGIGFKAVFSVAEHVFIKSGYYSFKFNSNETLGRLMPEWHHFPQSPIPGSTSILLQLRKKDAYERIGRDIERLDASILMFLRNIKKVEVELHLPSPNYPIRRFELQRTDEIGEYYGLSLRTLLATPDRHSAYFIHRYLVEDLPEEPKRKGCTDSEIVLAFPTDLPPSPGEQKDQASLPTCKVYSFLPVRDYGFKVSFQLYTSC